MHTKSTTINFFHLSALVAVILISVSVMGAGCSTSGTVTTDVSNTATEHSQMPDMEHSTDTKQPTDSAAAAPAETSVGAMVSTSVNVTVPAMKPSASSYKDGTYSVTGVYSSPAGAEEIDVKLTLKKDVVADATVVGKATNPKSVYMQNQFISGYKQMVVGKNIAEIQLGKISGSSLTPKGFNDAVAKIKLQAAL